ncbi:MAG: hypothetical protein M3179_03890 [Actinomycetota bacterium]|nr:hypothetical protein [Actinomycetota bacterium]
MSTPTGKITRDDIEAKLRQLRGEADKVEESAKGPLALVGGAVGVVMLGLAFLLGKRKGKKVSTTVEIRRV